MREKTIVCFINKINENSQLLIMASEDSGFKANELLKDVVKKFNGKGGGRDNFAMGSISLEFSGKAIKTLKELLKNS